MSRSVMVSVACGLLALLLLPGCRKPGVDPTRGNLEKAQGAAGPEEQMAASGPGEPMVDPEMERRRQRETVKTIRNVGGALVAWLTDQLSAAAAGAGESVIVHISGKRFTYDDSISTSELAELLTPTYLQEVPENDAWGHPLQYFFNPHEFTAEAFALIRSPGANGSFEADEYEVRKFPPEEFGGDLVWADGYFVQIPERP